MTELSLSAVILAFLLVPTILCIFTFKIVYPKNILKISDTQIVVMGIGLTFLFNYICNRNIFLNYLEQISPPLIISSEGIQEYLIFAIFKELKQIPILYLYYVIVPVVWFLVLIISSKMIWVHFIKFPVEKHPPKTWYSKLFFSVHTWINDSVINHIAKLTAFNQNDGQLIVDILDNSDSLYSGIFLNYHLEDKKLAGIELANVIRYSFKTEEKRKEEKILYGKTVSSVPYLLPSNGKMFFPIEKIQNFHIWRIPKDHLEKINLNTIQSQFKFSWFIGLKYSLPHLDLNIEGFLKKSDVTTEKIDGLRKSTNALRLNFEKEILPNIKIIN